ncbi:MAG TPA: hypothetical protein VMW00_06295 [Dehalococcoidales bacterium]|nr:hypothetical protein [Dehalococcoidales bacterium]
MARGVKIFLCTDVDKGTPWLPAKCNADGSLCVDTTPGTKTAPEVLNEATIAAAATTVIGDCDDIDLSHGPATLALTVEATYNAAATQGIRVHVLTSYDGVNFDTEDWSTWEVNFTAGATIRQTSVYNTDPYIVRVLVENLDPAQAVTGVVITATVGA